MAEVYQRIQYLVAGFGLLSILCLLVAGLLLFFSGGWDR